MRHLLLCLAVLFSPVARAGVTAARTLDVVPVITAAAYAQGDQMGALTKLAGALPCSGCPITLETVIAHDLGKVKDAFDVYFFSREVTLASVDNGAFSLTDANMTLGFAGRLSIAALDFVDTANSSYALKQPALMLAGTSGSDLWMALVCTDAGGCDWNAVGDLVFRLVYRE